MLVLQAGESEFDPYKPEGKIGVAEGDVFRQRRYLSKPEPPVSIPGAHGIHRKAGCGFLLN